MFYTFQDFKNLMTSLDMVPVPGVCLGADARKPNEHAGATVLCLTSLFTAQAD